MLRKPWSEAVTIKLLGKTVVRYFTMKERLRMTWKLVGGYDVMDIGHGFFMVKFDLPNDREKVITEIRFPSLGIEYYDESVLLALDTVVGLPIKVGRIGPKATEALLVLIPKIDHPKTFKDFRLISLCNVVYKLVSKVLVNRLWPILMRLVSPLQSNFIPGRGTMDNAIILLEIIHSMSKSRRKKGDVVFKLDLEKAYDRVDWRFVEEVLVTFGFPMTVIRMIMSSIKTSVISLLWNGERMEGFLPQRGLRQGDPLSPYLFVLCMERLGHMPYFVGPPISHLFFADDVLIFAKAKPAQIRRVATVLEKFCTTLGLKVNIQKSKTLASRGVPTRRKNKITSITDINFTNVLGEVLGFPNGTRSSFLAAWNGRLLARPGRVTLVNFVLSSIPAYTMQTQWLPSGTCEKLDAISWKFIWSGFDSHMMHLVN
uniref:Retrovirus-related Pol polyprotein LINE-1 n=1 Tax=Cajanus cajan TaxID=3821 RepID=A0A151RRB7_CAJCA|nr:Retrovirus-related Pol polyprotein LINE-1 [Cajanus cajan]